MSSDPGGGLRVRSALAVKEMCDATGNGDADRLRGLIKKYPKLIDSTHGEVSTPTTGIAKRRGAICCLGLGKSLW